MMQEIDGLFVVMLTTTFKRNILKIIVMGQGYSLLLSCSGVLSALLQHQGVDIPTAQSFLTYVLLCLVFTVMLACRSSEARGLGFVLRSFWWKYLILVIIDVEANYLMVKAYRYTTITSVRLLLCFTVASVMVLSYFVFQVTYTLLHVVGVITSLVGMGGLIAADVLTGRNSNDSHSNVVLGDVLVITAAILYGFANIGVEYSVKHYDWTEYLGMLGLFGSFLCGIQSILLESEEVANVDFTNYKIVLCELGFTLCHFTAYWCQVAVMCRSNAIAASLFLLSTNFYTLLFGIFLFHYHFHVLYLVAYFVIITGIGIYSLRETKTRQSQN